MRKLIVLAAAMLLSATGLFAGVLMELDRPEASELQIGGFELMEAADVEIEAVGRRSDDMGRNWFSSDRRDNAMSVAAWVLRSDTREPVWELSYDDSRSLKGSLRRGSEQMRLEPGRYEVYLFSHHREHHWRQQDDDDSLLERMFKGKVSRIEDDLPECFIRVTTRDRVRSQRFEPDGAMPNTLVRIHETGDSQFIEEAFELTRPATVELYAFEERSGRHASDYGWILNLDTMERVWTTDDRLGRHAGGARKNRMVKDDVQLPAGRYVLGFGTDDSHAFPEFNATAPLDPLNWGITMLAGQGFDRSAFRTIDRPEMIPSIDMTRAGDGEVLEAAFRLDRKSTLHVRAVGEYSSRDFFDRGWIVDASTGEVAWEMTRRNTVSAGGAEKNRMFDGPVTLPAGTYQAYYMTDSSHSYVDWNAAAPFLPEAWGMAIAPMEGARIEKLDLDEVEADDNVLASIVRVSDDVRERDRFRLDAPTRVMIYALGEGDHGEMYDYGYIVDGDGRRVWRMDYDETRHAGGADKNRSYRGDLMLEPGEYEVVYVTDDSHSFGEWNASGPDDPLAWGITVRAQ
ncbi:hypothetical protein ABI59_14090 [Acidobacteria bacterium Mor1]|nr:hypothetical protein ABI59_14090 [Acidobacteria bacterium Mor1]